MQLILDTHPAEYICQAFVGPMLSDKSAEGW